MSFFWKTSRLLGLCWKNLLKLIKMKSSKIKLYGLGNEDNFSYYTFEKTKKAHKVLESLFKKIFDINWSLIKEVIYGDKEKTKLIKVDISKNADFHEKIQEGLSHKIEENRIDVFYGKDKMFLVIHCPISKRKEFNKKIKNKVIMPKQGIRSSNFKIYPGHKNNKK